MKFDNERNNLILAYELITKSSDSRTFFTYLLNYIEIIYQNYELLNLIKVEADNEFDRDSVNCKSLEKEAYKETKTYAVKLIDYIQTTFSDEESLSRVDRMKALMQGRIETSTGELSSLYNEVLEVIEGLNNDNVSKDEILINSYEKNENGFIKWKFAPSYISYLGAKKELEAIQMTKWWYYWENLELLWAIHTTYKALFEENSEKHKLLSLACLVDFKHELDEIIINNKEEDSAHFTRERYNLFINGFHLKLLRILNNEYSGKKTNSAQLIMSDSRVCIKINNGDVMIIKTLRPDMPQHNFMKYIINHPNENISRGVINTEVEGCYTKKDMTELVRSCGFDKRFKRVFFPGTSTSKVFFKPLAELNTEQMQVLNEYRKKS